MKWKEKAVQERKSFIVFLVCTILTPVVHRLPSLIGHSNTEITEEKPFDSRKYRGGGSLIAMAEHRCGGLLMAGARVVGAG
ncbi:hypothetical protein V6N11_059194 [Hibiscus sabdariffa]|uniref:Uncharacterized protein n=1 Tax=Hibiscus sabdariffa TaxID=183260 RepID=A0ABR2U736_9ROSI